MNDLFTCTNDSAFCPGPEGYDPDRDCDTKICPLCRRELLGVEVA